MHSSKLTLRSAATTPSSLSFYCGSITPSIPDDKGHEHERPKKRQRTIGSSAATHTGLSTFQDGYLCFAKVELLLGFAPLGNVQEPSAFRSRSPQPVVLKTLERLSKVGPSVLCQVTSLHGEILLDRVFSGECPPQTLDILQRVIDIPKLSPKKTASRIFCTLSQQPDVDQGLGESFLLSARIFLPNNGELLQGSAFDRRLVHENCGLNDSFHRDRPWSPRDFYDSAFVPDKRELLSSFPRINSLRCQLYPFQQRAIQWLLHRERHSTVDDGSANPQLPHGFVRTVDADGKPCFISPFLGIMTDDKRLLQDFLETKGGILAEEMGLGKTVEIIGLICLNKQPGVPPGEDVAPASLRGCSATLVITPPSILKQWKNELLTLAPDLKVMIYEGLRVMDRDDNESYHSRFDTHNIVLTTYNTLAAEIHHSGHVPEREFRSQKKYERRLSPLPQRKWWRVVLDEAQMIESGVSNAAKVAQLIPRHNAWCVSGTPVRKNSQDLRGLLIFLRCPPYCWSPQLWDRLILERRDLFRQLFGSIAMRHTKEQIKDDIQLPAQRRIVITVPFTQIEKQNYLNLYNQMCEECGFDGDGNPTSDGWDPEASSTVEKMRSWLLRLRQTCLHAEVGIRNRKALGKGSNPLRTVDEVLEVMTEQNMTALRSEERAVLLSRAKKGQIFEHARRSKEALAIWLESLKESQIIVAEARAKSSTAIKESYEEANSQPAALRQRLRSALELEHMLLFFAANAYYQIKSDQKETKPESLEFEKLGRQEEEYYERAKMIRKEILVEARDKADSLMSALREKSVNHSFVKIPDSNTRTHQGGIESRSVLERLEDVKEFIAKQAHQINEWRADVTKLLLLPLVDEEDTDLQGDEYETSTQQQDTVYSYVDALRAMVADFHDIITGQKNLLIDHEMKVALQNAVAGAGHSPELLKALLRAREELKPPAGTGSVRGVVTDLRELRTLLRGQLEKGSVRAGAELGIVNDSLNALQLLSVTLSKAAAALEREVEMFTDIMNARLEYYRQLQQISDTVASYEEELDEQEFARAMAEADMTEKRLRNRIIGLQSGDLGTVYLDCHVSRIPNQGSGHEECSESPTCKKRLDQQDIHQITYKPLELTVQEETQARDQTEEKAGDGGNRGIYTDIDPSVLNAIKRVDMDTKRSFGTKIDSIARHIIWLRNADPGSKSIVFSQFRDFLAVLGTAFASFKIGYASIDGKNGVERFKDDAGIECLLMHAKGNASGLTLVNATHVLLCEPLINTAIELQAIARVHRIGQHQATTVWVYVVENTVEKSIYDISVERRMTHIGRTERAEAMERQIEAADTLELEGAALGKLMSSGKNGGEVVDKEDVWNCLFRHRPGQMQQLSPTLGREVERHLGASAAEERRDDDEIVS
ncbi:MAG: hypothetical protein Q9224_002860 [Gallowayella concinna]